MKPNCHPYNVSLILEPQVCKLRMYVQIYTLCITEEHDILQHH